MKLTLFLLAAPLFAQSFEMARLEGFAFDAQAATAPPASPAPPVATAPTPVVTPVAPASAMNSRFFAGGVSGEASYAPHATGWGVYATELSTSQRLYSYTILQFNRGVGNTIQTFTSTGLALYIRNLGPFSIYGNATAGVGTNGSVTAGAFSGGVAAIGSFKQGSPWVYVIGYNIIKSTISTASSLQVGIGYVLQ